MKRIRSFLALSLAIVTILLLLFVSITPLITHAEPMSSTQRVQQAWQNAQQSGAYHFATNIEQTTFPAPTLANVGRSSRASQLFIEGDTDLPNKSLSLILWNGGGSAQNPKDGIEIRIDGDKATGRQIGGQWQAIDNFSDSFAPGGDLTTYLIGAKHIERADDANSTAHNFTRYTFTLNGPAFAAHLRDQLEAELLKKGELPAGINLDISEQFKDITGQGEVWLSAQNMPLRLSIHLDYPRQANGERIEANIQTDFSNFAALEQVHNPVARLAAGFGLPATAKDLGQTGQQVAAIFGLVGLVFLMLYYCRSKPVYATFAILIIFSMVGTPLLRSHQVYAFSKKMEAKRVEQEQTQQAQADAQTVHVEMTAPTWNPNIDPLSNDSQSAAIAKPLPTLSPMNALQIPDNNPDSDHDGLTDVEEDSIGTDINNPDSDSDGLNDGVEVLRLDTNPLNEDSDFDGIPDQLEVVGFAKDEGAAPWYDDGLRRWYSDPNNPDTNNDGTPDGVECPARTKPNADANTICRDTDGDHTPDIFDADNDGDGVNDRIDLSPNTTFGTDNPFTRNNPFQLKVNNLNPNYPVFVDLQLRPTNEEHLTYALNVLDWPAGDEAGQVQRRLGNHSTFASGSTNAGTANQNGDMRLIPMLEIEIPWKHAPLSKIPAATQMQLRGEDITPATPEPVYTTWLTANVALKQVSLQNTNTLSFTFNFGVQSSIDHATIYPGNCNTGPTGDAVYQYNNLNDGDTRDEPSTSVNSVADGEHLILLEKGDHTPACATIPDIPDGGKQWKMIDTAPLQAYGISIRDKNNEGTLLAYVPLSVVNDETGGARVAFSAHIPYELSNPGWGEAHKIRTVWVVQMLTDYCRPMPKDYPEPFAMAQKDSWCDMDVNWVTDNTQIVHTYDDEFTLTGLSVREDHGLNVAIAYEDPDAETEAERKTDNWLWGAARGIEDAFVSGRDEDDNKIRDLGLVTQTEGITVADHLLDIDAVTTRWGIPVTSSLRIQSYPSYAHQDDIAQIMMTETVKLLDKHFLAYQTSGADAPTLLFAREERYRSAGLDSVNSISTTGSKLTLNLDTSHHPVETLASMNWAPYRYQNGEWQSYPLDEYWDLMGVRLQNVFSADDYPKSGEEISLGSIAIAKAFYLSMTQGRVGLTQVGNQLTYQFNSAQKDAEIRHFITDAITAGGKVSGIIKGNVDSIATAIYTAYKTSMRGMDSSNLLSNISNGAKFVLKAVGTTVKKGVTTGLGNLKGLFGNSMTRLDKAKFGAAVSMAVVTVATVVLTIASYALSNHTAAFVVQTTLNVLNVTVAVVNVVKAGFTVLKAAVLAVSFADFVASMANAISKTAIKLGVIGLIISVVVTWGAFIATMAIGGVKFWSSGFNTAMAGAIAATATAVVMFAIMFIPIVGQIIVAVIALIDAVIFALCGAFNWSEGAVGQYICKGISGWFSEGVKWLIYDYTIMVDFEADDRFQLSQFDQNFSNAHKGTSVGNSINYSAHITNTIDLVNVPIDWKAAAFAWQYNTKNLKSSTFDYQWQSAETDIDDTLSRNTMSGQWHLTDGKRPIYLSKDISTDTPVALETAGINQNVPLVLSEGYAVPAQECWAVPIIPLTLYPLAPVCYVRSEKSTLHIDLGQNLPYDIFPETLDDFYTLTAIGDGYTLAWGQRGDTIFLRQKDADGDGARNKADGGSDPNDSLWDSDGDTLSDYFEMQNGSSPTDVNADADGLDDFLEALLGTDPNRADSDSDGLPDDAEVNGWAYVYAFDNNGSPLQTWVTSDPLVVDTDGDGLTDLQEKTFGLNPRAFSDPTILKFESKIAESNAPKLLLQFSENNGAIAFNDSSGAENHAQCLGNCPTAGVVGRYGNALSFSGGESVIAGGNGIDTAQTFTLAAWVKLDDLPSRVMRFISLKNQKAQLKYDNGDLLFRIHIGGSTQAIRVTNPMQTGRWYHLAGTFDGSEMRLYVDGQNVGSLSASGNVHHGDGVQLSYDTAAQSLDGALDEVAIFDHALSVGEINALRHARYNPSDLIVKPDDNLHYRATVENNLTNQYAQGLLNADFGDVLSGNVPPVSFVLPPQGSTEISGDLNVANTAASSVISLTQQAGALITDWSEQSDGAAVWLKLDEADGAHTFIDSSGRQPPHDGTCSGTGCPTAAEGIFGNALHFDGNNDVVTADGTNFGNWQQVTLAGWVKFDTLSSPARLMSLGNNQAYLEYDSNSLMFHISAGSGNGIVSTSNFKTGRFYHIAATYDGNKIKLYIDGAEKASSNFSYGEIDAGNRLRLSQSNRPLDGILDDVRVYPRALSIDEINNLYGAPILQMHLDEAVQNSGVTLYTDDSQVGNEAWCMSGFCPQSDSGIVGNSVRLDGESFLKLSPNGQLNLSDGQFSLLAWVHPDKQVEPQNPNCPLTANYYDGNDNLVFTECEDGESWSESGWQIDHNWGTGGTGHGTGINNFSVKWRGDFYFPAGWYSFAVDGDDTISISVDGNTIVSYTDNESGISEYIDRQKDFHLTGGVHRIGVNYIEGTGTAIAKARWTPPHVQGIWGADTGKNNAYPTLETVGRKLRISFGDGTYLRSKTTTDNVLTANQWNHIVVTYDADDTANNLVLYVNDVRVQSWNLNGATPANGVNQFDIGRSGDTAKIYLDKIRVLDEGDYGKNAEIFLKWKSDRLCVSGMEDVDDSDNCQWEGLGTGAVRQIDKIRSLTNSGTLSAWEADPNSADKLGEYTFSTNNPSERYLMFNWNNGTLTDFYLGDQNHWAFENPSIPFHGKLDEIAFYRRPLSAEDVDELYQTSGSILAHITLDDPPGSSNFENTVDLSGQNDGVCAGANCPTAGVSGRLNQSAYFDGANDYLTLPNSEGLTFSGDPFTLAAWVNPQSGGTILAKYNRNVSREYRLYLDNSGYVHFFYRGSPEIVSPYPIPFGSWSHIAVSNWGINGFKLLINGQQVASGDNNSDIGATSAPVTIGAHLNSGSPVGLFKGKIDDVQIYGGAQPNLAIDLFIYKAAPRLQLHLDESLGATQFIDAANGNNGLCSGNACPTTGADGQLGLAAKFDGVDDFITIPDSAALNAPTFAVGMWVKPTEIKSQRQMLLGKHANDGNDRNYNLMIVPNSMKLRFSLQEDDCSTGHFYDSIGSLIQNQWNHVMMLYNGTEFTLYVNGNKDSSHSLNSGVCQNNNPLKIGGGVDWIAPFAGYIDEVTFYNPNLLSEQGVRDIFQYQSKWVEEHQSHRLIIDADAPTSSLKSDRIYLPNEFAMMHIAASDAESRVTLAELGVRKTGWSTTRWIPALACLDADGSSAWCPEFDPTQADWGEGTYTLQTRAIDAVGNRESPSAGLTITVDGTPPILTTDITNGAIIGASAHPTLQNAWRVRLSGTVSDSGSGVESVIVTLLDENGQAAGFGAQQATLNNGHWTLDYGFETAPSGEYTLRATATDHAIYAQTGVGNQNTQDLVTFNIDGTPPTATLTTVLPNVLTDTLTLEGNVSDAPAPASGVAQTELAWLPTFPGSTWVNQTPPAGEILHLPFEDFPDKDGILTFRDISGEGHIGVCRGGKCPAEGQSGRIDNALSFDGRDDRVDLGQNDITQLTTNFTLMAWVKPNQLDSYRQQIIASARNNSADGFAFGLKRNGLRFSAFGVHDYDTANVELQADQWAHVAVVVSGGEVIFYVNGQPVENTTLVAPILPNSDDSLLIGMNTKVGGWNPIHAFDGLIDDVRIFNRPLGAAEIGSIFHAAGPALRLPFETAWISDGSPLNDQSGWAQSVLFHSTDALNKSARGQVGAYSLAFDGTDDYISVADNDGLDLSDGQFTQALWVYPDASGGNDTLIIGSDTYDDAPNRYPFIQIANHTQIKVGFGDGSALDSFTTGDVLTENAWNHVAATFDGESYKIYVNGIMVAQSEQFAGKTPDAIQRFDLGRGTATIGAPSCATLDLKWLKPLPYWAQSFRIKVDGDVVFTSEKYPHPGDEITLDESVDFCGNAQISMERGNYNDALAQQQWLPMGTQNINTAPTLKTYTFNSDSWSDATLCWRVIYDSDDLSYFKGKLDDVRIETRALSALEIADLYRSGWQNTTLADAGALESTWSDSVPAGLEGAYQLALRGADTIGRFDVSPDTQNAWRGSADTLAPRLSIDRETQGDNYRYTVTAQDFNLTEDGFVSPCGIGVATDYQYYQSPWYQALSGQIVNTNQKLFQLTAECEVAINAALTESGAYDTPGLARQVAVSGDVAYVADGVRGLQIIDVSNPASPQWLGVYDTPSADDIPIDARGVALHGGYVYVADYNRHLLVLDASNPSQPALIGERFVGLGELNGDIEFSGNTAFVASLHGLQTFDISDPANPIWLDYASADGAGLDVAVNGNHAYLASNAGEIMVVDISNLPNLSAGNRIDLPGIPHGLAYANGYLYSAHGFAGLRVFETSDPANPTPVARLNTPGYARDVTLDGDTAYVADGRKGLQVIDISDPTHPSFINSGDTPDGARGTAVSGNYAYVADFRQGLRIINLAGIGGTATACDTAGNCANASIETPRESMSAQAMADTSTLGITILNVPSVLDSVNPFDIIGTAHATTDSLRALTVTVDSSPIYTEGWSIDTITETDWTANWSIFGEGLHRIQSDLLAWDGNTATDVFTVAVDVALPTVSITPTLLTQTHYHVPNAIDLSGLAIDGGGVEQVQISITGASADYSAKISGDDWLATWYLGAATPPDGESYTVTARAIDIAGRSSQVSESVTIDVVSPSPVTPTLNAAGTVRDASPTLTLNWPAATDGSGLSGYLVNWQLENSFGITHTEMQIANTAPRTANINPPEATKITARATAADIYGHTNWQSTAPVYIDTPLTPDYIPLTDTDGIYLGWMDSGCSLIGVDRHVSRFAPAGESPNAEQNFYASWNAEALRLAWQGANWSADGDLFIYLDTQTGGTTTAFNPNPDSTLITLPDAMTADYLLWVRDAQSAFLLRWDGTIWDFESVLTFDAGQYRFDAGHTDIYIPFDLLGIADPTATALTLVAFAAEENSLQLWATMPNTNPLGDGGDISLTHSYHWNTLGDGVCLNGSDGSSAPYLDSDLDFSFTAEPASAVLMGNGQIISYTLHYQNYGTVTATNVLADIFAQNALRLPNGELPDQTRQVLLLGDIAPNEMGSVTFPGIIDLTAAQNDYTTCTATQPDYACEYLLTQASVSVKTYDTAHPPTGEAIATWENTHPVDASPPEFVGITSPEYMLAAGQNSLFGYAFDDSGVPLVTLEIQPPVGAPTTLICPDTEPNDGQWTCDWNLNGANNGDTFGVRLQATDSFGLTGSWTDWGNMVVDTQPPNIDLSQNTTQTISGTILKQSNISFLGTVNDNYGLKNMEACLDGACTPVGIQLDSTPTQIYDDVPALPIVIDGSATCGGGEIIRTFTVTDSFTIGEVEFAFNAEHSHRNELQATLQSPQGTQVRLLYHDGSADSLQNYDVYLRDSAGSPYNSGIGDDVTTPYFDRDARPNQPLSLFRGENAVGTWTLSVCDLNSAENNGAYRRSQLILNAQNSAAQTGRWSFQIPEQYQLDYASKTIQFYAEDLVGNRTNPLDATFTIDNIPPTLTATLVTASSPLTFTLPALVGTADDGGAVSNVYVTVQNPTGRTYAERVELTGSDWHYELRPTMPGHYILWVRAGDLAGNIAEITPFEIDITSPTKLYLPLIMRNYTPPTIAPDLVVSDIIATSNQVQVVIRNDGNASATNAFWVDAYINPHTVPTAVNQIWENMGDEGLVWGIDGDILPILPGQVFTLTVQGTVTQTIGDEYFWAEYSHVSWTLPEGTSVYAQVDSANADTNYGNVLENHEIDGGVYNNITGPISATVLSLRTRLPTDTGNPYLDQNNLPGRPDTIVTLPPESKPDMLFKIWLPLLLKN